MSSSDYHAQAAALSVLNSVLSGLVECLASTEADAAEPELLGALLSEAMLQAGAAQLHGVPALLRIASGAVLPGPSPVAGPDRGRVTEWFGMLQRYCEDHLDPAQHQSMIEQLAQLPFVAALPGKLQAYLLERLSETQRHLRVLLKSAQDSEEEGTAETTSSAFAEGALAIPPAGRPEYFALSAGESALNAAHLGPGSVPGAVSPDAFEAVFEPEVARDEWLTNDPGPSAFGSGLKLFETDQEEGLACGPSLAQPRSGDPERVLEQSEDRGSLSPAPPEGPQAPPGRAEIWISTEELQLALDAVGSQILPSVSALDDELTADDRGRLVSELEFNLGLVGNAMEVMGTARLADLIRSMQDYVGVRTAPDPAMLTNWTAALLAFLECPNQESAETLAIFSEELPPAGEQWSQLLADEAACIRVGLDPSIVANRKTRMLVADASLDIAPDVLPNVLEGMLRELPDNAARLGRAIRWLVSTGEVGSIDEARRVAHTLKGDANTVGVSGLANLSHVLEDVLGDLQRHPQKLSDRLGNDLNEAADCIEEIADFLSGAKTQPDTVLDVSQRILDWSLTLSDASTVELRGPRVETIQRESGTEQASGLQDLGSEVPAPKEAPIAPAADGWQSSRTATLNVPVTLLDELQRIAGETEVLARQVEQRLGLLELMHQEQLAESRNAAILLGKLDDLVSLRGAALQSTALRHGTEVDPLELDQYNDLHVVSRQLLESNSDSTVHQRRLDALLVELDEIRSQQQAIHADLLRGVQRARTVPFDRISGRLQRIVRQTARQLEKEVALHLSGEDTQIESELLDQIVEPLGHLLRNAIDHGLESVEEREAAGKNSQGNISVAVTINADTLQILVADDGRGLDYAGIQRKAIELGLLSAQAESNETELSQMILTAGFTTRTEATQVSGRGIGMDVVNQRVGDLRGQLTLSSRRGAGLSVRMRFPVSQGVANLIIAHGNGLIAGAVAGAVERVHGYHADEIEVDSLGHLALPVDGALYPLVAIEALYGIQEGSMSIPASGSGLGLLVSDSAGNRVIVAVSSVGDVGRFIVKPVSAYLPPIPAIRGMALLGDGSLASVVDLSLLLDSLTARDQRWRSIEFFQQTVARQTILVADDSLSVRRALSELLTDAGYDIVLARDGLDALDRINAAPPDLVMLDLEMPKLNGLEVTRFMRAQARTREIPVVMISSRASEKYRIQAENAGVNRMLGKPYSEDELLQIVRELIGLKQAAAMESVE